MPWPRHLAQFRLDLRRRHVPVHDRRLRRQHHLVVLLRQVVPVKARGGPVGERDGADLAGLAPDPLSDDKVALPQPPPDLGVKPWRRDMHQREEHELQRRPRPLQRYDRRPHPEPGHLNDLHNPVTVPNRDSRR